MALPVVDVAVNIVQAPDGRVLLAERTPGQTAAGFWELPGGKIDPGETASEAAARELDEEIGIKPNQLRPWIAYEHAFPTKRVRLHFFRVDGWTGAPHGREGQRLAWVDPSAPAVAPVLPSNDRVLLALGLPHLLTIVDPDEHSGPQACLARLPHAFSAGLRLVQLRAPRLAPDQRVNFARRVAELARPFDARVLLAGSAIEASRAGVTGVHSGARELRRMSARPQTRLWCTSCHDAADLARAAALGADLAVVSPVLSCSDLPPRALLGWKGLRRLAADSPIPIYAAGGMSVNSLADAQRASAAGIAAGLDRMMGSRAN